MTPALNLVQSTAAFFLVYTAPILADLFLSAGRGVLPDLEFFSGRREKMFVVECNRHERLSQAGKSGAVTVDIA